MGEVFHTGLRIGKYELTRKLAEGGFGTLHVARDTALDRDVVIKFVLPEHANNQQVVQRFVQEGRSLAKVVHPGIVTVYETGEVRGTGTAADGSAYIIMELLVGETLAQRLQRSGRLSVAVAMEICRQIANALQAAHAQGIVHRDLKPDNIMLVRDPALSLGERAKVLDFGIAKLARSATQMANATQDGLVFGTPIYMSPEQAKSTASAGPSSDIYSLGCILFELLVGRPPFAGTMVELITQHILTPPPVPSQHAPGIPPHLDHVIAAMMAKTPEERPATMTVVETILEEKRAVDSMARRRTLGGAQLATTPPPVRGTPIAPAGLAAAMADVMAARQQPAALQAATPMPLVQPAVQAAQPAPTPMPTPMLGPAPASSAQPVPVPAQWPSSSAPPVMAPVTLPAPYAVGAPSPQHGLAAPSPQHGLAVPSPQHGLAAPSPQHGLAAPPASHGPVHALPDPATSISLPTPAPRSDNALVMFAIIAAVVLVGGVIAAVLLVGT